MKVSIITVCLNSADTIEDAIQSVLSQTYKNIEYIIVDGGSTDGTLEIINKYRNRIAKFVSEKDRGIYDAMNKGIKLAAGEIIGTLNSDDFYASNDVIYNIVQQIETQNADALWGDLVQVSRNNPSRGLMFWRSSPYKEGKFKNGWLPPHPTLFVRKKIYNQHGLFNLDFGTAADYELMLRFLEKYKIQGTYLPEILVKQRLGGASNRSIIRLIKSHFNSYRAWQVNGLKVSFLRLTLKPIRIAIRVLRGFLKLDDIFQ